MAVEEEESKRRSLTLSLTHTHTHAQTHGALAWFNFDSPLCFPGVILGFMAAADVCLELHGCVCLCVWTYTPVFDRMA